MPPNTGIGLPSRLVPAPQGVRGILFLFASLNILLISSAVSGNIITSGMVLL